MQGRGASVAVEAHCTVDGTRHDDSQSRRAGIDEPRASEVRQARLDWACWCGGRETLALHTSHTSYLCLLDRRQGVQGNTVGGLAGPSVCSLTPRRTLELSGRRDVARGREKRTCPSIAGRWMLHPRVVADLRGSTA